jgi:DENN (AEX-3) domain
MFTLIDKDGKRMYGMCLRSLCQGESRRYDVKRRPRHCLCIISRHPFISLFRTLLWEIHALSMIEQQQGSVRTFVELAYNQSCSMIQQNSEKITINRASLPELSQDFHILSPRHVRLSRVATILPLLETLGEKFLLILSAVLCERRIILIADETNTLFTAVLGLAAMLHPFQWQHIFIPLLPSKLMSYTASKIPYIMGVRRYMYQQLLREQLDDVILVDVDKGEYRVVGGVCIRDFVGESGNALKQATESLDRVRQRASDMASMFLRNTGATSSSALTSDSDSGHRDIVALIMSDLKAALTAKPGGSSVSAVATGLFRGLPGGVKSTMEESKGVWTLETEKLLRDTLLQFFAVLFADIEDFLSPGQVQQDGTVKALFDRNGFMSRRGSATSGDSRAMLEFLSDFVRTKTFSKFCDGKLAEKKGRETADSSSSGWGRGSGLPSLSSSYALDEEDDFHAVCSDLRNKQIINSVVNVRLSVAARTAVTASALNIDNSNGSCKGLIGMDFHPLTVQFTLGQKDDSSDMSESAMGPGQQSIDRICTESHCTDAFSKIMNTITLRLDSCKAATCRGTGGQIGVRTLNLLRALLISGPECVLSASIDYIPVIRVILSQCGGGGPTPQGLEFMSLGPVVDIRVIALAVLSLLLDHKKLSHQRRYSSQCREGVYSYIYLQSAASATSLFCPLNHQKMHKRTSDSLRRELFVNVNTAGSSTSTKQFPGFQSLLTALKPPGALSADPTRLKLTEPVEASSEKREEDEEDDANDAENHSTSTRESSAPLTVNIKSSSVVNLLDDSFEDSLTQTPSTPSLNPMISGSVTPRYSPTFVPSVSTFQASVPAPVPLAVVQAPAHAPLVEVFEDDAIYRIVNQDTGEVHDLRDLDKMMSMTRPVSTPLKHAHVPTLAPPPPPGQMRRPPSRTPATAAFHAPATVPTGSSSAPHSNGSSPVNGFGNMNANGASQSQRPKPADPFASLTPLIPNSPMRPPQTLAQTSSSSFTPSYSTHSPPSVPFASSSSSSYLPSNSTGMVGFNGSRSTNNVVGSSSAVSNPFEGFAPTPATLSPFQTQNPLTPRGTLGINPQHAARDKGEKGESPGSFDPFADLLSNIKN